MKRGGTHAKKTEGKRTPGVAHNLSHRRDLFLSPYQLPGVREVL